MSMTAVRMTELLSDIMDGNEVIEPMADRLEGRTIIGDLVSPETGELIAAERRYDNS